MTKMPTLLHLVSSDAFGGQCKQRGRCCGIAFPNQNSNVIFVKIEFCDKLFVKLGDLMKVETIAHETGDLLPLLLDDDGLIVMLNLGQVGSQN